MNRIDRLTAIITLLQSKKYVQAESIAERFNISIRTVYRDLKALEEAGVPITVETGKGYYLVDGYHLPPVMFTHNEANAFIVAEKILENSTDLSVFRQYQSALTKIRAVLRTEEKLLAESLDSRISVSPFPGNNSPSGGFMAEILQAISKKNRLEITYHASYNNKITRRIVEPIGIIYYGLNWHLIGYCLLRNDFRDFKITKIQALKLTDQYFNEHNNYSLNAYYEHLTKSTEIINVRILFDGETAELMGNQKYYYGLISETRTQDGVEMGFAIDSLDYIAKWLLSFGRKIEIVAPNELKSVLKNYAVELYEKYAWKFRENKKLLKR